MESYIDRFIRRLSVIISKSGGYNYFFKKILNYKSDVLQKRILSSEFFSKDLKIIEPNLKKYERILIIAPHQDDELIGPGGSLIQLRNLGANISILFFTDGNQKQTKFGDDIRTIRRNESTKVCKRLNADFKFLNVSNITFDINRNHIKEIIDYTLSADPDLILVPWFLDAPSHRFVNYIFSSILMNVKLYENEIWSYETHNQIFPNIIVDITNEIDEKIDLIKIYASQIEGEFKWDHITKGKNAYNAKFLPKAHDNKKLFAEMFTNLPYDKYIELSLMETSDFHDSYWGNKQIINSLNNFKIILKKL